MAKLITHYMEQNGGFGDYQDHIETVLQSAAQYSFTQLNTPKDIDIVIANSDHRVIPESHMGGVENWAQMITITIDLPNLDRNVADGDLFITACHEIAHATRDQTNSEYMVNLCDGMVNEGLATYFGIQSALDNNYNLGYFEQAMYDCPDDENQRILTILADELGNERYDYYGIFFDGVPERNLPRWSGYSLGYYIVKKYIEHTCKPFAEVLTLPYATLRKFAEEELL